ncbi:MAG: hypothetical protein ACP5NL_06370, partial [Thermoplasmata archaeon]
GSYSYSVGAVSGYTASPSSGTITVNGANVNQAITFTESSTTSNSEIYSIVNSTSISTYTLPEAEEFTIGSGSGNINYVVLYLSGSGSIEFSIGSTLWGSNILANQTVNVNSNQIWYNISIASLGLNGNSDYYLNVYQASGTVQWGYTSSPSSNSKNYVQDYWYSSGTLSNDDSYPNIYTVGYSSQSVPTPTTYTVAFTESGLASGTTWSTTFNGNTESSTSTTISYTGIADGSYSYSVGAVSGYTASPSSGTITVNGVNVNQAITFTANTPPTTNEVYAIVNATSSNIYTYTLPESEEFTINGTSNVNANYVTLYLSGSGSVQFSIGTTLWGSNILPNTTVNVVNGKVWYTITIPTITLKGGSDYFLNLYSSSSVQWGYTSNPTTSSFNYIQDYWFNNGSLTQDNSYPDIFAIGLS